MMQVDVGDKTVQGDATATEEASHGKTICAECCYPRYRVLTLCLTPRCGVGVELGPPDLVTGERRYPWKEVEKCPLCREKNDGHCPDFERIKPVEPPPAPENVLRTQGW